MSLRNALKRSRRDRVINGLNAKEFRVAFQPIIRACTGSLSGVECLLRWQHPDYGLLTPGSFADAFEDVKVARATSNFVLESVCQQLADWRRSGGTVPSRVAVNVQPLQMIDDSFSQQIQVVTKKYGIDPGVLELELVETDDIAKVLSIHEFTRALRKLGVRIALDDVGTGYTSLTILDRMHVDTIKLARELLTGVPDSPSACTVLSSMLDLSLRLGIEAIVEGVETAEQMTWLVPRPDVYVQGYFVAGPVSSLSDAVGGKCEWVSRMLA